MIDEEMRAALVRRHVTLKEDEQAIAYHWFACALEAGPTIRAMLAGMGRVSVEVSAPSLVVTPEPKPVPLPAPALPVNRPGAPDLPFDRRQRFGLR